MAKKPEPPKLMTWDVYRAAHKPKIVGSIQAADADDLDMPPAHFRSQPIYSWVRHSLAEQRVSLR